MSSVKSSGTSKIINDDTKMMETSAENIFKKPVDPVNSDDQQFYEPIFNILVKFMMWEQIGDVKNVTSLSLISKYLTRIIAGRLKPEKTEKLMLMKKNEKPVCFRMVEIYFVYCMC